MIYECLEEKKIFERIELNWIEYTNKFKRRILKGTCSTFDKMLEYSKMD